MALTKKMLKAMALTDEQIDQIFDAHEESISALREYKEAAERLSNVEKDLVKANAKIEELEESNTKLKDVKAEYEKFKSETRAAATKRQQEGAYRKLLAEAGISEKRYDSIIRVSDVSGIEFDEKGEVKNKKAVLEEIEKEWADFKVTTKQQGADVSTPPEQGSGNTFDKLSLAEKMTYANDHPDAPEVKSWLAN